MRAILFPAQYPDYILETDRNIVKRSPALPDGSRIYVIYDNNRGGVVRRQERSFVDFLNWFERFNRSRLELYTERDGILERVEDGPCDLFTGIAA